MEPTLHTDQQLDHHALAHVADAHNVGCQVRLFGEPTAHRATYSPAIQANGVVIRTGHVVVVDQSTEPFVVVWRTGTVGIVMDITAQDVTVDLGYRALALPLRDARPDDERTRAIQHGDRVLLQGRPIEQAAITEVFVGDELAHPKRLRAHLARVVARTNAG